MHNSPKYPNVVVKMVGEDSNAGSIIGRVCTALGKGGVSVAEINKFRHDAFFGGDYNDLLVTVMKWVSITDSDEDVTDEYSDGEDRLDPDDDGSEDEDYEEDND